MSKPKTAARVPGVTVYPRGKKWAFIIYGEPDLLTGKRERIYQGGFTTDEAAWTEALNTKARITSGRPARTSDVTVQQFFREWLESIKNSVKQTTYTNYVDNFEAYILPVIGHRALKDIEVPVLNAFYRHLLAKGRKKPDNNTKMYEYWHARREMRDGLGPTPSTVARACNTTIYAARAAVLRYRRGRVPKALSAGLEPKSVRNIHRIIHLAFSDAIGWRYIDFNPAAHARLPRLGRTAKNRPKPWTIEELAAWLRVATTDRFAGLWVLAATTGMRRSELAGAERELLNLDEGVLIIEDTRVVVDGKAADSDGKGESSRRTISLDPFTTAALTSYLAMLDEERKAFGASYPTHGKLMCYEDGRRLHPDTVTRRFNRLVDRAGVRRIRLHDIRH